MKKLYRVEVNVAFDLMTYAENEEVAKVLARYYAKNELNNVWQDAFEFDTPRIVTELSEDDAWHGSIPYSFEYREQRTCEQLLTEERKNNGPQSDC